MFFYYLAVCRRGVGLRLCVQFFFFVSNPVATQIKNGVVASAVATFSGGSRFSFT